MIGKEKKKKEFKINFVQVIYVAFCILIILGYACQPIYATTIWEKSREIMSDVYGQVVGLSTIVAVVTASIALFMMNFSKSGRAVDESRSWLKRIIITWMILNGLGFIMAYAVHFFKVENGLRKGGVDCGHS